jgi:NitT/TauT family transport system substrate-binding protein
MEAAGQAVDIIYVADYANLVSNGLITNERTIQKHPDLVQGMVQAALRGLAYTVAHPDEAFDISLKHIPEVANDAQARAVNRAILDKSIEFWKAVPGELGRSEEADWQASLQIMQQMGLVSTEVNILDMFSNRFVREVNP